MRRVSAHCGEENLVHNDFTKRLNEYWFPEARMGIYKKIVTHFCFKKLSNSEELRSHYDLQKFCFKSIVN